MITDIKLPKLGVEMETARLAEWTVAEGDTVAEDDVIASVETEKVVFELPSPAAGRIHLEAALDEEYDVGARLGVIAGTAAEYQSLLATNGAEAPFPPTAELRDALTVERRGGEPLATPVARRVASAHDIDLSTIAGSGVRGAIRRRDIDAAIAALEVQPAIARAPEPAIAPLATPAVAESRVVKLSSMRRTIAKRMHASMQDTAQMTDIREHDVSALVDLRTRAVARTEALGFKLSYTALFARAAIMALEAVPILNSSLESDTELRQWNTVNLGIAVAITDGLLVPVVHNAERLSVRELNEQLGAVIARARDRTASAEELSGGTFTVTNFGSFGSHIGTPILMPPQVGILGIGAMLDRPVVRDGEIAVGKVLYTCLTVDHRVIDGEAAGRFQDELGRLLAEPELLLFG